MSKYKLTVEGQLVGEYETELEAQQALSVLHELMPTSEMHLGGPKRHHRRAADVGGTFNESYNDQE